MTGLILVDWFYCIYLSVSAYRIDFKKSSNFKCTWICSAPVRRSFARPSAPRLKFPFDKRYHMFLPLLIMPVSEGLVSNHISRVGQPHLRLLCQAPFPNPPEGPGGCIPMQNEALLGGHPAAISRGGNLNIGGVVDPWNMFRHHPESPNIQFDAHRRVVSKKVDISSRCKSIKSKLVQ
jgi:hypothetical protein